MDSSERKEKTMIRNSLERLNSVKQVVDNILKSSAVAIVGLSKNSGKTSCLNFLLSRIDTSSHLTGVMTTGRDGENLDLVFKNEKPEIILPKGVLFSTFHMEANRKSPFIEIIGVLNIDTPLGNIIIAKTIDNIQTQIIGPPSVNEQKNIVSFFKQFGTKTVLIDGSLDRRAIMLSELCDGVIYVAGASYSNKIDDIISEIDKEYHKSIIPMIDKQTIYGYDESENISIIYKSGERYTLNTLLGNEDNLNNELKQHNDNIDTIIINTAFTDRVYDKLKSSISKFSGRIVFFNSFNILLNKANFKHLLANCDIYTIYNVPIYAIAVNSFSDKGNHIDCSEIRDYVRNKYPSIPVIDTMEAY